MAPGRPASPRRSPSPNRGRSGRVSGKGSGAAGSAQTGGPGTWPLLPPRTLTGGDAPMTPSGPEVHALSPEAAGVSRRAPGAEGVSSGGAGVSRRPPGRIQAFSPEFDPQVELGTGALGERLTRFNGEVSRAISELGDAVDTVHGRIVGVETSQRSLVEGASTAIEALLHQARTEVGAQSESLRILRDDVVAEAMAKRAAVASAMASPRRMLRLAL